MKTMIVIATAAAWLVCPPCWGPDILLLGAAALVGTWIGGGA